MLRLTFFLSGILASINFYLTDSLIIQMSSMICLLIGLGIAIIWPEPLPPPPPPDLWSEAPEIKERNMKSCSNCGKAVDQKWSMCPYCSKKV
jgi:hypothetical protein|tara:strand:- start:610 stop:885 length:276 start_codon:yes stop_codon:yes gene_type:complete